jgi:hypothetical protein
VPDGSTLHADFAAVNVNFWITPNRANLDPESGGLVVYDLEAPQSWDFEAYNRRLDLISDFIGQQRPRAISVPYRENRALIFDSDLFHATAGSNFIPEYENTRINITMLFGVRERDQHHGATALDGWTSGGSALRPAWRSQALSHSRWSPRRA